MKILNNKIKFIHYRRFADGKPLARGGMTVAYYVKDDGGIAWESSRCSDKDNFSYSQGRKWAIGRMVEEGFHSGQTPKEFRKRQDSFAKSLGYTRVYSRKNVRKDNVLGFVVRRSEADGSLNVSGATA